MLRAQLETPGAGGVQQACNDEHNDGNHNGETEREKEQNECGGSTLMEGKVHHTHVCCGPSSVGNQMRCLTLDLQTRLGEIQWICDQLSYGGSHNRNDVGAGKGIRVVIFHWTQLVATT